MARPLTPPIGLNVEAAKTSAEINAELVCPLGTTSSPPGTHDYDPTRHNLIEGVSKCMISKQEAHAKSNGYCKSQGSHDEVYTEGSKMYKRVGAAAVINCHFQNGETTCYQLSKRLSDNSTITVCWSYSHHSSTELLPAHVSSSPWCSSLVWLNVLLAGNWGWRHWEPFYLPYHEPPLVIEWRWHMCWFLLDTKPLWHWGKWKSEPTGKRHLWPCHRPTCKCPLHRSKATGQLIHPAVGSNRVRYSCSWHKSLSLETNTRTDEIPEFHQSWRGFNHLTSN